MTGPGISSLDQPYPAMASQGNTGPSMSIPSMGQSWASHGQLWTNRSSQVQQWHIQPGPAISSEDQPGQARSSHCQWWLDRWAMPNMSCNVLSCPGLAIKLQFIYTHWLMHQISFHQFFNVMWTLIWRNCHYFMKFYNSLTILQPAKSFIRIIMFKVIVLK